MTAGFRTPEMNNHRIHSHLSVWPVSTLGLVLKLAKKILCKITCCNHPTFWQVCLYHLQLRPRPLYLYSELSSWKSSAKHSWTLPVFFTFSIREDFPTFTSSHLLQPISVRRSPPNSCSSLFPTPSTPHCAHFLSTHTRFGTPPWSSHTLSFNSSFTLFSQKYIQSCNFHFGIDAYLAHTLPEF